MKIRLSLCYILTVFVLLANSSKAQDLESLGIKKGVKIKGSLNLNAIGYYAHGIPQRRDAFNWFATGNLNVNLFGYSAPFSFSYSNANSSYSQPFNQFSLAPQYKWVKTYIGYSSMTFSNYTLAGHVFLGGGVELAPGKLKIAAMYGRLLKAVPFDPLDTLQYTQASYKRMGYGVKVGYESNGDVISTSVFAAKDDVNSIPYVLQESQLTPQQNVAVAVNFKKKFLDHFFVEGEYAVSALNKDIRGIGIEQDTVVFKPTHNLIRGLLPENPTSRYYDALNAAVGYQSTLYTLQFKFEQVAPEYQSLGAYYFNNDLRSFTVAPSVRLMQSKLNVSANVGMQENNLDDARQSTSKRVVGSLNVNYLPSEEWNVAMNYSNFTSYTNMRPRQDPFFNNTLDTLNFYQISQTTNVSVVRALGAKENPQSVMLTMGYQKANDRASYAGGSSQSNFVTINGSYSYSLIPGNTTFVVAGNVYTATAAETRTTYWGPTVSVTKSFFEKTLRGSWVSTYNESVSNQTEASPVLNNRISLSLSPKTEAGAKQNPHTLSFGISLLNQLQATQRQPAFSELTGTINYTYSF